MPRSLLSRMVSYRDRSAIRQLTRQAAAARRAGDWPGVVRATGGATILAPDRVDLLIQHAHALKETGDLDAALAIYARAAAAVPDDVDVRVHWASLLRRRGDESAAASVYARIVELAPGHTDAQRALRELGALGHLSTRALSPELIDRQLLAISDHFDGWRRETTDWLSSNASAPSAYALFRSTYPTPPPPPRATGNRHAQVSVVIIEARGADDAAIRATLDSLVDQSEPIRTIYILDAPGAVDRPVATVTPSLDLRAVERHDLAADTTAIIAAAGVVLDPQAVAWLRFACDHTDADLVFGDHDVIEQRWPGRALHSAPWFGGPFDRDALAASTVVPPVMLIRGAPLQMLRTADTAPVAEQMRAALLTAGKGVHIPRRLASLWKPSRRAQHAPATANKIEGASGAVGSGRPDVAGTAVPSRSRIAVILPTRDNSAMASAMVDSLLRTARHPERLDIVVCDNGTDPAESDRLRTHLGYVRATWRPTPGPFNWSAVNNAAAAVTEAPLLLFVNDDMVVQSPDWDLEIEQALIRPEIGAVGARLLYADGRHQHAGILFGVEPEALSVHEGVGADEADVGPYRRWRTPRCVGAVTGAFLATSRAVFNEVGHFYERLAIAYNDIDFCFGVRATGRRVLYQPRITATHFESTTRGSNMLRHQLAWDDTELAILAERWGEALGFDPGYNPQFATAGVPFAGYREPSPSEVVRHLSTEPWRVTRRPSP